MSAKFSDNLASDTIMYSFNFQQQRPNSFTIERKRDVHMMFLIDLGKFLLIEAIYVKTNVTYVAFKFFLIAH